MPPQKHFWLAVTVLCYLVSNAKLENITEQLSSSPQKIGVIVVGTADCNFCGMTFFGALSFKVITKYIKTNRKTHTIKYLILIELDDWCFLRSMDMIYFNN